MRAERVVVIGAGLVGSEAAYHLARCGVPVRLVEMKPAERLVAVAPAARPGVAVARAARPGMAVAP